MTSVPDPTSTLTSIALTRAPAPAEMKRVVLVVDDKPAMSLLIISILKL